MKVNVLRLDHRLKRDTRITTHVCLTARAFGASKIYLAGEKDNKLMDNVRDTAKRFGGNFEIEYTDSYMGIINQWKKNGGKVVQGEVTVLGFFDVIICPDHVRNLVEANGVFLRQSILFLTENVGVERICKTGMMIAKHDDHGGLGNG